MQAVIRPVLYLLFKLLLFSISQAAAADAENSWSGRRYSLSVGTYGLLDNNDVIIGSISLEGRRAQRLWQIRPVMLAFIGDQGDYYLGVGVLREWSMGERWALGIGTGVGYINIENDSEDLGYDLQFYSRLTLAYRLANRHWIRTEVGHVSNASLGESNPGSEIFQIGAVINF